MSTTETSDMSPEKRRVIRHFDHPNPAIVENIAGGWWRVWNHFNYHVDEKLCLSQMHDGWRLVAAAVLHSEAGYTGRIIALENTDFVLEWPSFDEDPEFDPGEAKPEKGMHDWMIDWMEAHPDGTFEEPLEPPRCIHGSSLADTFTRGSGTCLENSDDAFYVRLIRGTRVGYFRVTPERGEALQINYRERTTPKGDAHFAVLGREDWKNVCERLEL
jgi:hypothetical protein